MTLSEYKNLTTDRLYTQKEETLSGIKVGAEDVSTDSKMNSMIMVMSQRMKPSKS